jgi:predicted nucleic acid-binding protein
MRVLIDTSVWVDFFNRHPSREAEVLTRLIEDEVDLVTCGVVIAEFLQGIRRKESLPELEEHFRDMDCLAPREPDTYFAAAQLYRELRAKGLTVRSTIDCLIVRLAEENGALVLAKDHDMVQILGSGLTTARGLSSPHPD